MRKWKWIVAVAILCISCTACGGNKEETEVSEVETEEMTTEEVSTDEAFIEDVDELQTFTLTSESKETSIEIGIPTAFGFEQTEYSSESWLALQIPGKNEESSTQLMMYLEADKTVDVGQTMFEEVQYLLSANSDEEVGVESSVVLHGDYYEWYCLEYELEGLEGFKFWSEIKNGFVIAGTVENIGNSSESFNMDEFIRQIDKNIVID